MMQNRLISVVIPTYNRADILPACIASVLRQSHTELEVLVIDDASSDETEEVVHRIADPRLHYYRYEENRGACYARNYGAERAAGDLLAFQDSDDIWHREKLEKELALLRFSEADLVFCGMNRQSYEGNRYYYPVHGFHSDKAVEEMLTENRVSTQTMLMRRSVWETLRFDESFRRYQDWDFAIRAAEQFRIQYLAEALVESAVNSNSISATTASFPALQKLYQKHQGLYRRFPDADAVMNRRMATRLENTNPSDAAELYRKSFKLTHSVYDFGHYLFCRVRALSLS